MNTVLLSGTPLFRGTAQEEIKSMLSCLKAREQSYKKNEAIYRAGDQVQELGLVLSGSVSIEYDDIWGERTMLDRIALSAELSKMQREGLLTVEKSHFVLSEKMRRIADCLKGEAAALGAVCRTALTAFACAMVLGVQLPPQQQDDVPSFFF